MVLEVGKKKEEDLSLATAKNDLVEGLKRLLKVAAKAFGGKLALNLLLRLLSVLRSRKLSALSSKNLSLDIRDSLQFSAFLGSFSGSYVFLSKILHRVLPLHLKKAGIAEAVAGLLAGTAVGFDSSRRHVLAIYILPRALQGLYNYYKRLIWPEGKDNTLAGLVLFSLMSAQVMYSYVMRPDALTKSYHQFIVKSGPIPGMILDQIRRSNRGLPLDNALIVKSCQKGGGNLAGERAKKMLQNGDPLLCWVLHPQTDSCRQQFLQTWWGTFSKRFPLYLSLHTLATVIARRKAFLANPTQSLQHIVTNTVRSDAFLASFCAGYMALVCSHNNIFTVDHKSQYWWAGIFCSLSLLIEKKSRRDELTLYVLPRGLEALVGMLQARKLFPKIPGGDVLLFSASMATIMYYFQTNPTVLSPLLRKTLNALVGDA